MAADQPRFDRGHPDGEYPGAGSPVVEAIHVAPATRLPMRAVNSVEAEAGKGLVGDRYHGSRHRHVTVQAAPALRAAADALGRPIDPASTRRNITISSGEVPTAIGQRIRIGDVDLEVVRIAAPCKLLDDVIGEGARTALRRRAGTVFRLLSSGTITVGDRVDLDPPDPRSDGDPDDAPHEGSAGGSGGGTDRPPPGR